MGEAYCAGDLVNFVDPDGRMIYFAPGVPEWVKELYYALQHKKYGDKKYKEKKNTEDPQYKNQLEREVIEDYEWEIARKHGDIKENEKTREDHYGLPYIPHKALIYLYEVCGIAEKNRENCNIMLDSLKWELILKYYSTQQSH